MPHRIKKHSHVCNTAVLCGAHGAVCMCVFAYVVLCRWLIMLLASLACPTPLNVFFHVRTPLELPFLASRARSCARALAMASNSSWRIVAVMPAKVFYIAPFVVFRTATPPHQTERRSRPQVVRSLETEIEDQSETFVSIQNALLQLLDEDTADAPLMRNQ